MWSVLSPEHLVHRELHAFDGDVEVVSADIQRRIEVEHVAERTQEQPDNIQAKRLLVKIELWFNKPESAIDILNSIISNADIATDDDYFYAAIAHWFVNDIQKSIELFTHTLRKWKVRPDDVPKGLANAILRIDDLTKKYKRSLIDIRILTDIVADEMRADGSPNINND